VRRLIPLPALLAGLVALGAFLFLADRAHRAVRLSVEEGISDRLRAEATAAASAAGSRFRGWYAARTAREDRWKASEAGGFVVPAEPVPLESLRMPIDAPERLAFFLREGERAEHVARDLDGAAGFYRMATADTVPPGVRRIALARLAALESRRGNRTAALEHWRGAAGLAGDSELLLMAAVEGAVEVDETTGFIIRHLGGDSRGAVAAYTERLGLSDHPAVRARARTVRWMAAIRPHLLPPPPPGEIRTVVLGDGGRAFIEQQGVVVASPEDLEAILGPSEPPTDGVEHIAVPAPPPLTDFLLTAVAQPGEVASGVRSQSLLLLGALGTAGLAAVVSLVFMVRGVRRETELARLKSEFVANVSHELRTPLSVVRLYAETLANRRVPEGEEEEYAGIVLREADSLTRLVDRVLDFSRIERGEKEYVLAVGDLGAIVAEAGGRWPGDGPLVELPDEEVHGRFDREALLAAIGNLLDNAAKYAPGSDVLLALRRTDAGVKIEVRDRGPGLAADEAERVFGRFHRGEGAVRDAVRGSGLGLTLVRHAARGHGGDAGYEPRDGGGSVFFLRLPTEES